jgi:hypothetical protein
VLDEIVSDCVEVEAEADVSLLDEVESEVLEVLVLDALDETDDDDSVDGADDGE